MAIPSTKAPSAVKRQGGKRRGRTSPLLLPAIVVLVFGVRVLVAQRQRTDEFSSSASLQQPPQLSSSSRLQSKEMNDWIDKYPDTPGARLVHLLRTHLHYAPGAEDVRMDDCRKDKRVCFGGAQATDSMKTTLVPTTNLTMQDVVHVNNGGRIPRLGTDPVCLPLVLAAQAIADSDGVVVEFGPFAGMTTRCIGIGLMNHTTTATQDALLYSFDTFDNKDNWNAITSQAKWVRKAPEYDVTSDFLWLWKLVAQQFHRTARPIKGFITAETANPTVWNDQPIALLSLDSVKDVLHWQDQLAGIRRLKAGSILALQDFASSDQPTLIYECLRQEYLIPVFTSWDFWEPWVFVVKKDWGLQLPCRCMKNTQDDYADTMEEQLRLDLDFLGDQSMVQKKNATFVKLSQTFRTSGSCNVRALRARARAGRKICGRSSNK